MVVTSSPLVARAGRTEKISVATCTSSNGKPSSTVSWETKLKGEAEFQEIRNGNGTVTVVSRYRLLPSREAHRQQLVCVVNYQLDRFTDSMTLNVLCEWGGPGGRGETGPAGRVGVQALFRAGLDPGRFSVPGFSPAGGRHRSDSPGLWPPPA